MKNNIFAPITNLKSCKTISLPQVSSSSKFTSSSYLLTTSCEQRKTFIKIFSLSNISFHPRIQFRHLFTILPLSCPFFSGPIHHIQLSRITFGIVRWTNFFLSFVLGKNQLTSCFFKKELSCLFIYLSFARDQSSFKRSCSVSKAKMNFAGRLLPFLL